MLACRPMLSFAIAVMAGAMLARLAPELMAWHGVGWLVFLVLATWFLLTPRTAPDPESLGLPSGYARHVVPTPGFVARRGLNRFILIACLGFFLLGALRQAAWRERLEPARLPERNWFDATLLALAPSRQHAGQGGRWRVAALLLAADGKRLDGVPVRLSGPAGEDFRRGDLVSARVRRELVRPPAFPGTFDFRFWLERDGLAGSLSVAALRRGEEKADRYTVVPMDDVSLSTRARRLVDAVRAKAIALTLEYGGDDGPMLAAMLYGYRDELGGDLRDTFRRVGIGHVLAISGLHVGLVVGLLWWLSGLVGWSGRWRAVACLLLAFFYLGLAGGQVAASRATLMAVIHLGGIAWGRKSDMLNSLGAAAFFLTLINPSAPMDISFQLSFTAVVFIHLALRRAPERDRPERSRPKDAASRLRRRVAGEVASLVRLSIFTWLGLFPIIAVVFHQVNLIGLPINVVVIPLMALVLGGGLLLPWLGWLPGAAWLLLLPSRLLVAVAFWADELPFSSFPANAPATAWIIVFYLCVCLLLLDGMLEPGRFKFRWRLGAGIGALAAVAGMVFSMAPAPPPAEGRLALLPGRGFGVIAVESGEGGVALLGDLSRNGLTEADWLHQVRRAGGVGVLSLGKKSAGDLAALAYHYPLAAFTAIPNVDAKDKVAAWRPVPGAPGVEYAVSRDGKGKVVWLAARTGGGSVCVASEMSERQLAWRLERGIPGSKADLLVIGLGAKDAKLPPNPAPRGMVGVFGRHSGALPVNWFERGGFGALVLDGGLRGYDGECWRAITRRRAPDDGARLPAGSEE